MEAEMKTIAALALLLATMALVGCDYQRGTHTHRVDLSDDYLQEYVWFVYDGESNLKCGTVGHWRYNPLWQARAYDDYSSIHYFNSEGEAQAWLTNWCK